MTTTRLSAEHVTVRFGGLLALDDVGIDVRPSEIVGLIGPNGAGKSTLFSVLSGLRRPEAGTVRLAEHDISKLGARARARLGLARTFQHPSLFHDLTVREHVVLANRMLHAPHRTLTDLVSFAGLWRRDRAEEQRVDDLIDVLGLSSLAHRPVAGLPLGQARLVEVARAIARGPDVLLIDEGSSGLDQRETEQLIGVLRKLVSERGVSLLLVEHDVELVSGLCDRICVLEFGRLIASGTPAEIRDNRAVRAAYLGAEVAG